MRTPLKLTCLLLALWAISAVFLLPVAHVYADPTSNAAAASNLTGSSSSSLSGITTTTAPTTSNNSTTVGSTPTEYGYICTPDNTTQGSAFNVQRCVNNIYIFSIAVASFVAIIMFVFAGYLYISGDSNRISEAKDIMQSTITALVLLFSVYLILNFIDPSFNNIPGAILPAIHCGATQSAQSANNTASGYVNCLPPPPAAVNGVTGGTNSTAPAASGNSQAIALQLLNENGNGITFQTGTDCPGNGPLQNLQSIAQGLEAQRDGATGCNLGTTNLSASMLQSLQNAKDAGFNITVTSLASGHHSTDNDPHYQGLAADAVPPAGQQTAVAQSFFTSGASVVAIECVVGGTHYYMPLNSSNPSQPVNSKYNLSVCSSGTPGYHIHEQFVS